MSFAIIYWLGVVSMEFNKQLESRDTPHCSLSISFLRTQVPSLAQRDKGDQVTATNWANLFILFCKSPFLCALWVEGPVLGTDSGSKMKQATWYSTPKGRAEPGRFYFPVAL